MATGGFCLKFLLGFDNLGNGDLAGVSLYGDGDGLRVG